MRDTPTKLPAPSAEESVREKARTAASPHKKSDPFHNIQNVNKGKFKEHRGGRARTLHCVSTRTGADYPSAPASPIR